MNFKGSVLGIPPSKGLVEILREKRPLSLIVTVLAVILGLYHTYTSFAGCPPEQLHRGIHLCGILVIIFLSSSLKREGRGYLAANIILALLAAGILSFICYDYENIPFRESEGTTFDIILGGITIVLVMEAVRRIVGMGMTILIIFFLIYTFWGQYFPGAMRHAGYSLRDMLDLQFLSLNGLWSVPIGVMSTYIIIFLIFAGFLMKSGAINWFMDIAIKAFGRTLGGPAKAAIIASTLMGSVSGAAAANVLVTGSVSIPLMKRLGYKPSFAGAVEASVSSGGQFMPPIMGASAFIMAALLEIPYIQVCLHAAIPALLWFFAFFMIVHFEARRLGLSPIPREEIPPMRKVLRNLHFIIPIVALVYFLIAGRSPMLGGFFAVVLLIALTFIRKETRLNLGTFFASFEYGIRAAMPVAAACAGAGIIIGCVMQTGIGFYLSAALVKISGGHLFVLLMLVLVASLILGMGMVTVGAYVIVSILVSPALIEMGVTPIASHFFPFYFAIISAITPPVAVASYAAAGLAEASPWDTGWQGMRLAIPALLIPFIFVTQPPLVFIGSPFEILATTVTAIIGLTCLAAATVGCMFERLTTYERIMLTITAITFVWPIGPINLVGLGLLAMVIILQKKRTGKFSLL